MINLKKYPNQKQLQEMFYYENGELFWKIRKQKVNRNKPAGYKHSSGYGFITIKDSMYKTHRLIYIFHNGKVPKSKEIDHIDRNPKNNKIENLRVISHQMNLLNTNSQGHYFNKKRKKWFAVITINKKCRFLGYFQTKNEAKQIYLSEKRKIFDGLVGI